MNADGLQLIMASEGFVNHWYPDPAHGWKVPTCCFGHTDAAGAPKYRDAPKRTFTRKEGEEILAHDLEAVEKAVQLHVKVPLNENQLSALCSFVYNLGVGNFIGSTLLRLLNAGDYKGAAAQFDRWVYANGVKLPGLVTRRAKERELFLRSVDATVPHPEPATSTPDAPQPWYIILVLFILKLLGAKNV